MGGENIGCGCLGSDSAHYLQTRRFFKRAVGVGQDDVASSGFGIQAVGRQLQAGDARACAQGDQVGHQVHAGIHSAFGDAATCGETDVAT